MRKTSEYCNGSLEPTKVNKLGTPTVWSAIKRQKESRADAQRSQDKNLFNNLFEGTKPLPEYCIEEQEKLTVTLNGKQLIAGDKFTNADLTEPSKIVMETGIINDIPVFNTYNAAGNQFRYRREVAINKDQRLEISTRMQLLPYVDVEGGKLDYHLFIPFKLIEGGNFKAWSGKSGVGRNKLLTGKAGESLSEMRYIAFSDCELKFVIDFNPYGITDWMDYCKWGNATARWQMEKDGDYLKLSSPNQAHCHGGSYARKIMIYPGKWDFETRHPYDKFSYLGHAEPQLRLAFGSSCNDIADAGDCVYTPEKQWGWLDLSDKHNGINNRNIKSGNYAQNTQKDIPNKNALVHLKIINTNTPSLRNGSAASSSDGSFVIDMPPGYYVLPISCINTKNDSGPFSISLNGRKKVSDVQLKKAERGEYILHAYARDGKLQLDFSGDNWCISTIAVKALIYTGEDFFIDRGFWHHDKLPDFIDDKCPPEIHKKILESGGNNPLDSEDEWRYNARITHFGNSCYDVRNSATLQDDVERRIKDIYDEGFSVMMLDGWHMWPCFQDKLGSWTELTAQKVEIAHRYGIRVIDHFDVPCVVYANTGYEFLLKSLDWCQRDIRYGEPTLRMFCLNNPGFRNLFLEFLEEYARYTQIDAVMLDECTFAGKDFCGCRHCRDKFTKDTGLVLPEECESEHFFNLQSRLWTAWLKWRQKSIGDWWVDVKTALRKGSPGASVMQYITHYGFSDSWAPLELGIDLWENSRACDFLGTEIMTRNIMDSYRSVNAYRKMKAPLSRRSGTPLFAFNYHTGNPDLAYFGWALLHMNNQICLADAIEGTDINYYVQWKWQMDKNSVSPIADIAILFSRQCRDFGEGDLHHREALGISESLSDAHIMHGFLFDEEINAETLNNYKLLILPNASCMSDAQIEEVIKFVSSGGRLLTTGNTAENDEHGAERPVSGLKVLLDEGQKNQEIKSEKTVEVIEKVQNGSDPFDKLRTGKQNPPRPKDVKMEGYACRVRSFAIDSVTNETVCDTGNTPGILNYEPELRVGQKWEYLRDEQMHHSLISTIHELSGELSLKPVNIPEKVLVSLYKDKGCFIINFLNASGVNIKPGETLNSDRKEIAFPELSEDIIFEMKIDDFTKCFVVSPDFEGELPLKIEKLNNGYAKITLDKKLLKVCCSVIVALDT